MLVVIDLQSCYEREFSQQRRLFKSLLENLKKRISVARTNSEPIVNLECFADGPTHPAAKNILYKCPTIYKEDYDGSEEVDQYIKRTGIYPDKIELCGAFANVCVLKTWTGLRELQYKMRPIDSSITIFTPIKKKIYIYPEGYLEEAVNDSD